MFEIYGKYSNRSQKNPNENNSSVLRRFSRRIQESGIIRKVKGTRYNLRKESKLKVKKAL